MGSTTIIFLLVALFLCTGQSRSVDPAKRASCVDQNEQCQAWAVRGECVANPNYMLTHCPVSCFQCTPSGGSGSHTGGTGSTGSGSSSGCQDQDSQCAAWASSGQCVSNPAYMFTHCPQSCDSCEISIVG